MRRSLEQFNILNFNTSIRAYLNPNKKGLIFKTQEPSQAYDIADITM